MNYSQWHWSIPDFSVAPKALGCNDSTHDLSSRSLYAMAIGGRGHFYANEQMRFRSFCIPSIEDLSLSSNCSLSLTPFLYPKLIKRLMCGLYWHWHFCGSFSNSMYNIEMTETIEWTTERREGENVPKFRKIETRSLSCFTYFKKVLMVKFANCVCVCVRMLVSSESLAEQCSCIVQ